MKKVWGWGVSLALLAQAAAAQSLGDLARKERERKAQQEQTAIKVTTDDVRKGKLDLSPPLDPARKGDLEYLLQQLARPKVTVELLASFVPLQDRAIPRLLTLVGSTDPLKRVAPATVLIVLGNTEGVAAMARMLVDATDAAASVAAGDSASPDEVFRERMEATREADLALIATKLGAWRFTEGSALTPAQVIERLQQGPAIEVVGGPDNGQRIFNRALRDKDPNLRRGADALMRAAAGGKDFGFRPDRPEDQNESAIQEMTTILTTERAKVIKAIGPKPK